ncbi:uncharacterized protein TRUGW13939_00033 [Talaromyces rugulosus]|uniref:FAD-binding domain-containing protein n=1 Tax=Talaromyces rugulosus TaxID=121627 RepID=A0A7H8QHB6_TALRU|nr:uncharacterized protein TRUGW13939_00033 [Talaromyces rugulosus]QKX52962.1 hypothetical protein TRUGW13939_00033 [Talaromyces rugulosus]
MATQKPIIIIGAGLSGLAAARLLTDQGIPVIVFEQSQPDRSQGYGLTLRDWAYNALLEELGNPIGVSDFQRAVATDGAIGRTGWVDLTFRNNGTGETLFNPDPPKPGQPNTIFRANRSFLRNWLAEGVDVRYEHKLEGFQGEPGHVSAFFENGVVQEGSILVAADGVHSTVRGVAFPGNQTLNILPVILFHGKVNIPRAKYETAVSTALGPSNVAAGVGDSFNTFITVASANKEDVHLDWSYSRARQGDNDPLWMPDRGELIKVPQHLLKEIRSRDLVPPFSTLVNADDIKKDKVYNWRIRSVYISRAQLDQAAKRGVVFIGDSVHAMPIFGGEGGNHAILDGVDLFRAIQAASDGRDKNDLRAGEVEVIAQTFYDTALGRSQDAVKRCVQRFSAFHRPIQEWKKIAGMSKT